MFDLSVSSDGRDTPEQFLEKLEIAEYSPRLVKQTVVGYGNAEKHQVQEMVRLLLRLKSIPEPHDAADALAIAICHFHHAGVAARLKLAK